MFACGLLGGLAEFPWVVGHRPLGTLPFTLGSLPEYPWILSACSLLASCLSFACRDAVRHVSTGRWLFRVSRLGRYIGWAAFLGRLVMVFFGGDGHSSSQGKSPGAAHMSAPGCLVIVVQYVKPVGISPLILPLACRDAARHRSWEAFQRRRIIALRSGCA